MVCGIVRLLCGAFPHSPHMRFRRVVSTRKNHAHLRSGGRVCRVSVLTSVRVRVAAVSATVASRVRVISDHKHFLSYPIKEYLDSSYMSILYNYKASRSQPISRRLQRHINQYLHDYKMEGECLICFGILDDSVHALPCNPGHLFHAKCILVWYDMCVGRFHPDNNKYMPPRCPYCKTNFRKKDLPKAPPKPPVPKAPPKPRGPRQPSSQELRMLREPSYSRMAEPDRPLREARRMVIVHRERTEEILQRLQAEKERLRALAARRDVSAEDDDGRGSPLFFVWKSTVTPVIVESSAS